MAESSTGRSKRQSKRRQAALYSDDEDDAHVASNVQSMKPSKRARVEEQDEEEENVDVDIDGEEEIDIEDEDDAPADDTRFLPPALRKMKAAQAQSTSTTKTKAKSQAKKSGARKKKTVVWSDDDDNDGYDTAERDAALRSDDEDFVPEDVSYKKSAISKVRGKGPIAGKSGRGGRSGKDDREIPMKDESRPTAALKRSVSAEESQSPAVNEEASVKDPTPPPLKRPKLPTIKKNKNPGTSTVPSKAIPKQPSTAEPKSELVIPVTGARKPAATVNNADFDLRDSRVYAQLFTKVALFSDSCGLW